MIPDQAIYVGKITHTRLIPKKHQFRYSYFSLLLDIDRLEPTLGKSYLIAFNRPNILSFYNRDHGQRDGNNIRNWVNQQLERHLMPSADKVFLLSFARMFGYAFNPFSVYFCYTKSALSCIVYEVKNTFGEQIAYVRRVQTDKDGVIRHEHEKELFVSPFIDMNQIYHFSVCSPSKKLAIRIKQCGPDGHTLIAAQNGSAIELNDLNLLKCILTQPLMTLKVIIGIHWEALMLYIKGITLISYSKDRTTDIVSNNERDIN
ncbi:MAG: DUF1365 domain-containing protein [Pseudomonadota bacterium]|nr:DUF1365 domain-containing protein [Pseudomonadota bacterium]